MSMILFVDESGHDLRVQPYEVLAGVAIEDREVWNLIRALRQKELQLFGCRYSDGSREIKARKLLKTKTYKLASRRSPFQDITQRAELARLALQEPISATHDQLAALAQAKLDYAASLLDLCGQYRAKAFATIVPRRAPRPPGGDYLRKDYAYLFERFYYYVEDFDSRIQGIVVFDELEKTQSHLLIQQMTEYFLKTQKGRIRSSRIIPEPFFVHSDLTTGVQLADLIAYIIGWGLTLPGMTEQARPELADLARQVGELEFRTRRPPFDITSFAVIDDLRPASQRGTS